MSKHIYDIPLKKMQTLLHVENLMSNPKDTQIQEYNKTFGKVYFYLELEKFIKTFKLNKDTNLALKSIKYFTSETFLSQIYKLLNLHVKNKDAFYKLVYVLKNKDKILFEDFFQKVFLHFYTSVNPSSNTHIDHIDLAKVIAKNKSISLKESFGKDEQKKDENAKVYFKIFFDEKCEICLQGNSIKTLRKKAYKMAMFKLLNL